jgi:hypothetical protein
MSVNPKDQEAVEPADTKDQEAVEEGKEKKQISDRRNDHTQCSASRAKSLRVERENQNILDTWMQRRLGCSVKEASESDAHR